MQEVNNRVAVIPGTTGGCDGKALNVRKAQPADLEQVMAWIPDAGACRLWAGPLVWFPLSLKTLTREIGFRRGHSYCLVDGSDLAAFGQLVDKGDGRGHLARVIVAPAMRGGGYGRRLCRELVGLARSAGYRTVSLNVYRDNSAALKLYRNLGFKEDPGRSTPESSFMVLEL